MHVQLLITKTKLEGKNGQFKEIPQVWTLSKEIMVPQRFHLIIQNVEFQHLTC